MAKKIAPNATIRPTDLMTAVDLLASVRELGDCPCVFAAIGSAKAMITCKEHGTLEGGIVITGWSPQQAYPLNVRQPLR